MLRAIIYLILLLFSLVFISSCASEERITQRVYEKKLEASDKLRTFKASLTSSDNLSGFYKHEKTFVIPGKIDDVWKIYSQLAPRNMWSGPKNKFKMAYSKQSKMGFYKKEKNIPSPSEGMVYELKLKILKFLKIPVTFEITKLSQEEKTIEFTYGMDNKSHGKQILHFEQIDNGTKVTHTSYFKSGNKIRDKRLYPFFHEKCIDEFHENMTKWLIDFVSVG